MISCIIEIVSYGNIICMIQLYMILPIMTILTFRGAPRVANPGQIKGLENLWHGHLVEENSKGYFIFLVHS
jgi:hypothetical protein